MIKVTTLQKLYMFNLLIALFLQKFKELRLVVLNIEFRLGVVEVLGPQALERNLDINRAIIQSLLAWVKPRIKSKSGGNSLVSMSSLNHGCATETVARNDYLLGVESDALRES